MNTTANYIANCITGRVEEKHPYFDFDNEYCDFSLDEEITARLIEILKSNHCFSEVNEIKVDEPIGDHICTIEIVHNKIAYRFSIEIYICKRSYKYLKVTVC
jgi:hypothetical protein